MWKVSACNCSICQIKVRGNIFLCIGAFSRQGAGYARANETASASPKSSMEKQLANRSGQKNVTGKRTRHTARKQDGALQNTRRQARDKASLHSDNAEYRRLYSADYTHHPAEQINRGSTFQLGRYAQRRRMIATACPIISSG